MLAQGYNGLTNTNHSKIKARWDYFHCFFSLCKVEFYQPSCWLYSAPKFACILAINNPVFRWESCKGSEWESVKKCSRLCKDAETRGWNSQVTRNWQAAKTGTRVKHAGELKSRANCCTIGQKSQAGQAISSWLELTTQPSHEAKSPDHPVW